MSRKTKTLFALLIPAVIVGCVSSLESTLLYHPAPGAKTYDPPPAPLQDLELLMPDDSRIHARWVVHPQATGAVLYCHGNGGNVELYGKTVREIWESLGESVLIFDYPGYGYSQGKPNEKSCEMAAETAYQWLIKTQKIPPGRIVLMGGSLGGAVAVDLASRHDYRALVLVRTFSSVPDMADDQFPLLFSAPFVPDTFDSLKKIPLCKKPIFIAQADKDRTVPFRHGQRLAKACTGPVELYVLKGLDHNDPLPAEFYGSLKQFLAKAPPRNE